MMLTLNKMRVGLVAGAVFLLSSQGASAVALDLISSTNGAGQATLSGVLSNLAGEVIKSYDVRLEINSGLVGSFTQSPLGARKLSAGVTQTQLPTGNFLRIFELTFPSALVPYSTAGLASFNLFEIVFNSSVTAPSLVTMLTTTSIVSLNGPLILDPPTPPIVPTEVPLPATAFLMGLGLLGVLGIRRRRV